MNLLWMCNIELPIISEALQTNIAFNGGWMDVLSRKIISEKHNLQIIYPKTGVKTVQKKLLDGITVYQIPHSKKNDSHFDKSYEEVFRKILTENEFDCIHMWGCEFPRSLAMTNVCKELNLLDKTVLEIQGIKHFIAKNYYASLPKKVINRNRIHDIYFNNSVKQTKQNYASAGKSELKTISIVKNIIGRTDWDLASVKSINPNVVYHKCNLILRRAFYDQKWQLKNCERHSMFVSSYATPVKGLHYILEAMPIILKKYPDAHLYVAGSYKFTANPSLADMLRLNGYGKHIYDLIKQNNLGDKVTLLGNMDEKSMMERYLKSHVFVSASSMENSPNTVAEATTLGVPVVSSLVGGVSSMLRHNTDGFLYQYDAPYMMAHYIKEMFNSDDLACSFSVNARKRATEAYDADTNYNCLLDVYHKLSNIN